MKIDDLNPEMQELFIEFAQETFKMALSHSHDVGVVTNLLCISCVYGITQMNLAPEHYETIKKGLIKNLDATREAYREETRWSFTQF